MKRALYVLMTFKSYWECFFPEITIHHNMTYDFRYDPTRMLLTFGAGINKRENMFGNTPLHYACITGNTCAIKLLMDANVQIDVQNNKVGIFLSVKFCKNQTK